MRLPVISILCLVLIAGGIFAARVSNLPAAYPPPPLIDADVVFEEVDGLVAIEAEHFQRQSMNSVRAWYINSPLHRPNAYPDYDDAPFHDAAGLAYVEALPDLFHSDEDPIIQGQNLGGAGGVAVLHYPVHFNRAGTYYLWTRLRSNDEEDNTVEAGIDGTWPPTAKILQSPVNKKEWIWRNDNRISRNPWKIGRATLEVTSPGVHEIQFAMREDGEEFDRFILTLDPAFKIETGFGPAPKLKSGKLPAPFDLKQTREPERRLLRNPDGALYGANVLFACPEGKLAIEAEDFYRQSLASSRMWHLTSAKLTPAIGPDSDPPHLEGASGGAYLELLPDARQKDEDAMHSGTSIYGVGGKAAVLSYLIEFGKTGKYFVWVRARATDGDDNTLHVGLDNSWPESGKKMLFQGKEWRWSNLQRDTKAAIFVDVPKAGIHELQLSMREDGCEIDRIFLSDQGDFDPNANEAALPAAIKKGSLAQWHASRDTQMQSAQIFEQVQDAVVIEVESAPATEGWRYFADGNGHAGYGYLKWMTKGQGIKAGTGLLSYQFSIKQEGDYQLLIRGRMHDPTNRPDTLDPDGNDIWAMFEGGANATGSAPLNASWNKLAILGHPAGWTWNTNYDAAKEHPITPVVRHFAPGVYRLTLSGRSEGYAIDRIALLRLADKMPLTDFAAKKLEELDRFVVPAR